MIKEFVDFKKYHFSSVQFSRSVVSNSLQPHGLQHTRLPLSFTISQSLLKLTSIESMMPSNHLILCCPLLLLPSMSRLFASSGQSIGASAIDLIPLNLQTYVYGRNGELSI